MVLQRFHMVVDCPVCGRPVELQSQIVNHEIACGHCQGRFVVYDADDGLTAAKLENSDSLERAENLLHASGKIVDDGLTGRCQRLFSLLDVPDDEERLEGCIEALPEDAECDAAQRQTALLVEHRDEAFARIATDMAEFGIRVIRARTATEALRLCARCETTMVVANIDLPDQSGWLLAGKLRFVDQRIRAWLYQPQSTDYDEGMANYLQVDQLLDYGGDLLGLSETIVALMADRREPSAAACIDEKNKELAAA